VSYARAGLGDAATALVDLAGDLTGIPLSFLTSLGPSSSADAVPSAQPVIPSASCDPLLISFALGGAVACAALWLARRSSR
jgi:hypothetical protein